MRLPAVLAVAVALAACGKRRDDEPAPGPGSTAGGSARGVAALLRPVATIRGRAILVGGTRRIALWVGDDRWYEPDARGLAAQPLLGAAIGRARAELGELADIFLGTRPIVAGGEEHRERVLRFSPSADTVAVPGLLVQVAAAGGLDVVLYEHELRTELATVDASGTVAAVPPLPLIGPAVEARSPVGAKACAAPKVRDLAVFDVAVVALVTECHPRAPVRLVVYSWPIAGEQPGATIMKLGSLADMDLEIDHLLVLPKGRPILVGRRRGTVVAQRIGPPGEPPPPVLGPAGVEAVTHAAVDGDDRVWTLSLGRDPDGRDRYVVARDGRPVELATAMGAPLRAESLAFDEHLGITILARDGAVRWLLAEHPPAELVEL
jgi:hypothetical protein